MTKFSGVKNGFNRSGMNECVPMPNQADTAYTGRPHVGKPGKLSRVPNLTGATGEGNRRLAKSNHGDGGGMATRVDGNNAFSKKGAPGKPSRVYDRSGGVGSGFRSGKSRKP